MGEETITQGVESREDGAPKIDPQIEERAKIQGWIPKEEFRGDQSRWIPAEEFVKRADHMMPILKSVNKKLETQVSEMNKKLADTQGMISKMVKINEKYGDDLFKTRVSDIKLQKRKAAEEGNWQLYDQLELKETAITPPEKIEVTPQPAQNATETVHPEVDRWMGENKSWFGVDPEMTEYAQFVGEQLKNSKSPLAVPGKEYEFCKAVEKKVKGAFKEKFVNPNQSRSDVDESRIRGGDSFDNGGRKGWSDLPDDAKRQCNKLMSEIPGYSKEKYIKEYFEGV